VAHGKSTVVKAISGVQTVRFKNELERNITIKLGYANAKIYKCPSCERPQCYKAFGSAKEDAPPCEYCSTPMDLVRHVSFVDCPGHDILMATMLNGAAVMDGALLLIAANETCPQPQTSEHLAAVEIMRLKDIIILQVWHASVAALSWQGCPGLFAEACDMVQMPMLSVACRTRLTSSQSQLQLTSMRQSRSSSKWVHRVKALVVTRTPFNVGFDAVALSLCFMSLRDHILLLTFCRSQGTIADGAPVVPVSAQLKYNIDVVCEYITKRIPVPKR
jgi:hypothetical protein